MRIRLEHLVDAPRSRRPNVACNPENERQIIAIVTKDRNGREKSGEVIASEVQSPISKQSVYRSLKKLGFKKVKKTTKPGLNDAQKARRLEFCQKYRHWTLEDWKKVIWSDETAVIAGLRRGSYKVWRQPHESQLPEVTRMRWKSYMEFMFWGCFSWHRKGPCHIWKVEMEKERKAAKEEIDAWNLAMEPVLRQLHEEAHPDEPFVFDAAHGKRQRRAKKGGIDWYRYGTIILEKKLLPFAFKHQKDFPGTIVQEDGAPSHVHHSQQQYFDFWGIQKLLWPGNSPDLNAIEPAWPFLKRRSTHNGVLARGLAIKLRWRNEWKRMPMASIRKWVERIPRHIERILSPEINGGNNYREGRKNFDSRTTL